MSDIIQTAKQCLKYEAQSILELLPRIDSNFERAAEIILACKGKCIVTGVGKSGHVGRKIAATFASTGTPAFFLNPLDAYHGDLGMVTEQDVVLALSYSGCTDELLRIIPSLRQRHIPVVSITGTSDSLLAKYSDCCLDISVNHEADPLNLAPTSSTATMLAMGDALACALITMRGFKETDFARFHPGGSLGKRLLASVGECMKTENLPMARKQDKVSDTIIEISKCKMGMAVVLEEGRIVGVVTDGDVRRAMQKYQNTFFDLCVEDIMTRNPKKIHKNAKLEQAAHLLLSNSIHTLIVVDDEENYVGLIDYFSCQL